MRPKALTAATAALLLTGPILAAQEAPSTADPAQLESVYVDVEGAAVQIPVALAAEACGMDEVAIRDAALARMAEGEGAAALGTAEVTSSEAAPGEAAEGNQTVTNAQGTADPSTADPGSEMLPLAVCQIDLVRATELGVPTSNQTVTD